MDALQALQQRVSCALLTEPGPDKAQIDALIKTGLRAPDHANLRPWRFLLIQGDARAKLGEVLVQSALCKDPDLSAEKQEKLRKKPFRAPTIVVAVAIVSEHPKAPEIEQLLSAGAAANNIVTAAYAMGIGAYWRTGSAAYDEVVKSGLGLADNEEIVGFIYLGMPRCDLKPTPQLAVEDFLVEWQG